MQLTETVKLKLNKEHLLSEDDYSDGEEEFVFPEVYDEPFDEILGELLKKITKISRI